MAKPNAISENGAGLAGTWRLPFGAFYNYACKFQFMSWNLDEAHSSPGLHAAAGPGFAEECATLGGCRTGMAKVTHAYDLPARRVIHTVGPKYAVKYHTAAENALSHCYRSCLELLVENGLRRLLPLYFPRDKQEEAIAILKLPADVGDENGETVIDERKIRIKPLPNLKKTGSRIREISTDLPIQIRDAENSGKKLLRHEVVGTFAKMLGYGDLGGPPLSAAEEYSLHSRYLAKANSLNLSEIAEMKIVYRGGVDNEGRPVMVVVGAHFLLRCLDLERFVLYVVKEFEPLIQKPYTIVYFHSAASLQATGSGMDEEAIYVLHPTFGLKAAVFALQLLVDNMVKGTRYPVSSSKAYEISNFDIQVWKKVVYVDRLLQLFRYVPREQLTIPDFVFQ
ncbi:UNVERIFIED_CONTAM: Ganglioside-induced differentiation-associated protein 2 [Sesamum radiatum]|uniref:Ganglioside-induced differentiation-associated protein 2 n=1 Tax=Sesamum radiatum TaxID=300843 RepID=A0AAW2MZ41_SESRA